MSRKVKIFLGAYANIINAQNINCLSLAKNLDKSKFDITILSLYSGSEIEIKGVNIFKCYWPHRIFVYWAYFWNIMKSGNVTFLHTKTAEIHNSMPRMPFSRWIY